MKEMKVTVRRIAVLQDKVEILDSDDEEIDSLLHVIFESLFLIRKRLEKQIEEKK